MSIAITDWLADNGTRKYPFDDQASGVAESGLALPFDLLADLKITLEGTTATPYISGVFINTRLLSITICSEAGPQLLGTFYRPDLLAYVPYQLAEVMGSRAAGTIVFGPAALNTVPRNYIFDATSGALSPHSYVLRGFTYVKSLRSISSLAAASGHVEVLGTGGVTAAATASTLTIGLDDRGLADLQGSIACVAPAINAINNVAPDEQGRIFLRFK